MELVKQQIQGLSQSLSDGRGVSTGTSFGDSKKGQGVSKSNSNSLSNANGLSHAVSNANGMTQGTTFSFRTYCWCFSCIPSI